MSKSTRIHVDRDGSSSIIALERDSISISMLLDPDADREEISELLEELQQRVDRVDGSEGSDR